MFKELHSIEGKTIMSVHPIISELTNDLPRIQIVFTDDTEITFSIDELHKGSLDWKVQ